MKKIGTLHTTKRRKKTNKRHQNYKKNSKKHKMNTQPHKVPSKVLEVTITGLVKFC